MASPKTCGDQGDHPFFGYFKDNFHYWKYFITPEPISSDLQEKVRLDLLNNGTPSGFDGSEGALTQIGRGMIPRRSFWIASSGT